VARLRPQPERTCVGCRGRAPQRELVRLVAADPMGVRPDPTGKAPGRGAYLHPDAACLRLALRRGALAQALRTRLSDEEAGNLTVALREMLKT
jgi:predicted RNA-binding protein YlxR (DUF448 family)